VPNRFTTSEAKKFYYRFGNWFGGKVRVAHILVSFRDPVSGRLKQGAALFEARQQVVRILNQLKKDGSNFGELASKYSDDKVSARRSGVLGWLNRFEPYVPASVLRTAWALKDGQVSSPIESYFGKHLVQRIKFIQNHFIIPGPKQMPLIRRIYHRFMKEDFLFTVRKRHKIERYL
jgi:parvulin-like peptidyl-prolyl isomerase